MIPVLGIPILVGYDVLERLLGTIDTEVGEIIVVDNGGVVPDDVPFTVVRPGGNLGVAASWNHIIKIRPKAEWWMISNFDIDYGPGDLERLAAYVTESRGVGLLSGFTAFGVHRDAIAKVGLFDEMFHPAYFEDNDFDYRCRLAGVPMAPVHSSSWHHNSSTLELSAEARAGNSRTFELNHAYYLAKWGGEPYAEVHQTPFNGGGRRDDTHFDFTRLTSLQW